MLNATLSVILKHCGLKKTLVQWRKAKFSFRWKYSYTFKNLCAFKKLPKGNGYIQEMRKLKSLLYENYSKTSQNISKGKIFTSSFISGMKHKIRTRKSQCVKTENHQQCLIWIWVFIISFLKFSEKWKFHLRNCFW